MRLSKWFRWDQGRQLTGYGKILLASSKRLKFDCYILRIPDGVSVPAHTDPAPHGFSHHRINIQLTRTTPSTGKMVVHGPVKYFLFGRGVYFRPDLFEHWLSSGEISGEKTTFIFTFGWLTSATP